MILSNPLCNRSMLAATLVLFAILASSTALRAQDVPARGPAPVAGAEGGPTIAPSPRGGRSGGRGAPLAPGNGPTCAFDATIYEVHMPGSSIGRLDLDALSRASATAEGFEKALADLGTTTPLYRADQSVRLAGDSITIGTTKAYVSSSRLTAQGNAINTVQYADVGAVFGIAGKAAAPDTIEVDMTIQVSSLTEGTTEIATGVKAPQFRRSVMSHKGMVEARKPFVVASVDAANVDTDGKAVAYFARITLGELQSSARAARGE